MKNNPTLPPLRRSLLATPGNVPSKVEKSLNLPVDVLMLDLEDGVPNTDNAKARARDALGGALRAGGRFRPREIAIRLNGPRTPWFLDDVRFAATLDVPTLVVPMVNDASDMVFVERALAACGVGSSVGLILLIETPASILNLPEIVAASPRTNGMIGGGLDFAAGMRSLSILPIASASNPGREDDDLIYMRHRVLAVGRANGISVLDAMRPGLISDLDGFRADAKRARWLGFDGVDFYHPAFVDIANEVFSPSPEELDWARKVVEATSSLPEDAPASAKVEGRVVLPQHIEIAHRLLSQAAQIAQG